jgi:hypothetical protein
MPGGRKARAIRIRDLRDGDHGGSVCLWFN